LLELNQLRGTTPDAPLSVSRTRLVFRNADERARAARVGITDLDRKYDLHEMIRADAIFAATGVTSGALLDGVTVKDGFIHTHTLVMNSATRTVREVRMKRPV
jgi:fructose-1,6-bisphosphatase II / sedoheptulose-1,7-bisphosphatase